MKEIGKSKPFFPIRVPRNPMRFSGKAGHRNVPGSCSGDLEKLGQASGMKWATDKLKSTLNLERGSNSNLIPQRTMVSRLAGLHDLGDVSSKREGGKTRMLSGETHKPSNK